MSELIVWGAGGHGKVVLEAAQAQGFRIAAILDDRPEASRERFAPIPVYSPEDCPLQGRSFQFVIAIGNNGARAACFARALSFGWEPVSIVHPTAIVSPQTDIGAGTMILPRAIVNVGAVIGVNCIINSGAIVEHDCRVDEHVHIAPGTVLGGGAEIGSLALVGITASVLPLGRVGARSIIGAGAVVVSPIPENVVAVGVPARVLERLN